MAIFSIPTSKDIYLEINGTPIAVAQSYRATTSRESQAIEAFGSVEPVGTLAGRVKHTIQLTRVYVIQPADPIDFYALSDFNLVIVKPDRKIIYSQCQWSDIGEVANLNEMVIQNVTIVAAKRIEIR